MSCMEQVISYDDTLVFIGESENQVFLVWTPSVESL